MTRGTTTRPSADVDLGDPAGAAMEAAFTAKFQRQWQPRYRLYPGAADLPRVGVPALEAEAFSVWPSLRRIREGRP